MTLDENALRGAWEKTIAGSSPSGEIGATYRPAGRPAAADVSAAKKNEIGSLPTMAITAKSAPAAPAPASPTDNETMPGPRPAAPSPAPTGHAADTIDGPPREAGLPTTVAAPTFYELIEEIGRGGMGVVYRARQGSLRREVAIKKALWDPKNEKQERFVSEALVTGLLDHPNIVPVHDLGRTPDGEILLAMKLVEGVSWKQLLHPDSEDLRRRAAKCDLQFHLNVLLDVMNAVEFAHSKGLVHNDLKPDNVMVGEFGEVLVMDWGIAACVREAAPAEARAPHHATIETPCGTPAYMPPELAEGRGKDIGPWTDTYLLGAILHEILTGKPPRSGMSIVEAILAASRSAPPVFLADVPAELAEICKKALARRPENRYCTIAELRDALKGFLQHRESAAISGAARAALAEARAAASAGVESEAARNRLYAAFAEAVAGFRQAQVLWAGNQEAQAGERAARVAYAETALRNEDLGLAESQVASLLETQGSSEGEALRARVALAKRQRDRAVRHARLLRRSLVAAVAIIIVGLSVGIALVHAARRRAEADHAEALRQKHIAEAARLAAERRLAESLLLQGDTLGSAGRWGEARRHFEEARAVLVRLGQDPLPADLGLFSAHRSTIEPLLTLEGHAGGTQALAFTPDGARLVTGGADGAVRLWDAETGRLLAALEGGAGPVLAIAVSHDGRRAVTGGQDGRLRVHSLEPLARVRVLEESAGPVAAVALTPDGRAALGASHAAHLTLRDVETGAVERTLAGEVAGEEGRGTIPASTPAVERDEAAVAVAISPDGTLALAGRSDGSVDLYSLPDSSHIHTFPAAAPEESDAGKRGGDPVAALAFSPGGGLFAMAGKEKTVRLVSLKTWETLHELRGHAGPVSGFAFAPDGRSLLSVSRDRALKLWDVETGAELRSVIEHPAPLLAVAISPDGRRAASAGRDGPIAIWSFTHGLLRGETREVHAFADSAAATPATACVALSPDGLFAISAGEHGTLVVWDAATGRPLETLAGHRREVTSVAFAPRGRVAVSGSADGALCVWDADWWVSAKGAFAAHEGAVTGLAVAPDGRLAVSGGADGAVKVWDLESGAALRTLAAHEGKVTSVSLSSDGRLALSSGEDGWLRLSEVATGRALRSFGRPGHHVRRAALSADGRRALSGGTGGTMHLWDATTGGEIRALVGHTDVVRHVGFLSEDDLAVSASTDGTWRIWRLESGAEVRSFTADRERVVALDVAADGRRVITATGEGALRLWDLTRPGRQRELTGRLASSAVGRDEALVGEWYAFRGEWDLAVKYFERARARGAAVGALGLARAHWERGVLAAAHREIGRALAAKEAPEGYARLCQRALRAEEAARGSRLASAGAIAHAAALSPDGRTALAATETGAILVFETETGLPLRTIASGQGAVYGVSFSSDGRIAASSGKDGTVRYWDPATWRLLRTMRAKGESSIASAVSPDARRVLFANHEEPVRLCDGESGREIGELEAPGAPVRSLAFSPDGRLAAAGCADGKIVLWDVESRRAVKTLEAGDAAVDAIAFGPGGKRLVSAGADWTVRLWDVDAGREIRRASSHDFGVYCVAISQDGRLGASGSNDRTVRVFDLASGADVASFDGNEDAILGLAFSPDGKTIVTAGADGMVKMRAVEGLR